MSEFAPINTQEEFDNAIKTRIAREREKFEDYEELKNQKTTYETTISDLTAQINTANDKITSHDKTVAELNAKIKGYETASEKTRIALETGIPYTLAMRLTGETEDEIRKDAEGLAKIIGNKFVPPLKDTEPEGVSKSKAAYKALLDKLK